MEALETATAESPLRILSMRIDKVLERMGQSAEFVCVTMDRLVGSRPRDPSALVEQDCPAGEYYELMDKIDNLERTTTYLEGELDRLHGL